jgi:hypothetical protein
MFRIVVDFVSIWEEKASDCRADELWHGKAARDIKENSAGRAAEKTFVNSFKMQNILNE